VTDIVTFPLRVELPKGQHAMLRDPEDVPERLRRPHMDARERVMASLLGTGTTEADTEAARGGEPGAAAKLGAAMISSGAQGLKRQADDLLLVAFVESWSYETAISADAMQDLPGRAYDVLLKACEPLTAAMNPDFEPSPDPESPTSPSSV
jgi:hypothetical protein